MFENRGDRSEMHELTGLWKRTTAAGEEVLSGVNGTNRFVVLRNRAKRPGDHKPDFRLFVTREERREEKHITGNRRGNNVPS